MCHEFDYVHSKMLEFDLNAGNIFFKYRNIKKSPMIFFLKHFSFSQKK